MSKEEMKLSMNVNGHSKVPPGFRFHPTEEELLHYYLRKKVAYVKIDLDVIREVDLNKLEPWDIQDKCNIGTTPQNDWYFFSHKDKKYPTGTRTNRATASGFWKATGRDKVIHSSLQRIGMRKTLVFYKGRAPRGQKSDWIMHEYRLDDENIISIQESNVYNLWVVCRVFKKKNYHKSFDCPKRSLSSSIDTRSQLQAINKDGVLEQLLMYMDSKSCKQETNDFTTTHDDIHQFMNPNSDMFLHLLGLDSPTMTTFPPVSSDTFNQGSILKDYNSVNEFLLQVEHEKHIDNNMMMGDSDKCSDWEDLDKFVASHLDGQMEQTKHFSSCYGDPNYEFEQDLSRPNDIDIWSLARSLVDPICHVSV